MSTRIVPVDSPSPCVRTGARVGVQDHGTVTHRWEERFRSPVVRRDRDVLRTLGWTV